MTEKDIKLFDKTIHEIKFLANDIAKERKEHHKKLDILIRKHDIKINKMLKKTVKLVQELYELFADLQEEGEKKAKKVVQKIDKYIKSQEKKQ